MKQHCHNQSGSEQIVVVTTLLCNVVTTKTSCCCNVVSTGNYLLGGHQIGGMGTNWYGNLHEHFVWTPNCLYGHQHSVPIGMDTYRNSWYGYNVIFVLIYMYGHQIVGMDTYMNIEYGHNSVAILMVTK